MNGFERQGSVLPSSEHEATGSGASHPCLPVLLVSDVRLMRDGLAQVLASTERLRVVGAAATCEEAVLAVQSFEPAVVLLDMNFAQCAEIAQAVRNVAPSVGMVAFAVPPDDEGQLAYVEAGVTGFVSRQSSLPELIRAVECVARGEAFCTRRVVATLFRGLAAHSIANRLTPPLLSAREMQVVELIDGGLSNKEIAQQLRIGLPTVKNHVHHILEKLQVARRSEAAASLRKLSSPGTSINSSAFRRRVSSK